MTWRATLAADVYRKTHVEGEPLTTADVELDQIVDIGEAVRCWEEADALLAAVKAVKAVAAVRVGQLLGEGHATRSGDRILRYKVKRNERCIAPEAMIDYLTEQVDQGLVNLADVVNPNDLKRGWMTKAERETFYEWVPDNEPTVTATARDYAPKFLQELDEGQVI